jgi:ABC-2 type transport system ATP-binding protein
VGVIAGGRLLAESTVADLRGASAVLVRADPLDRALATASRIAGDDAVTVVDDGGGRALRLEGSDALVPALTRALVADEVDVREIRSVERSLEEVFFEMTGATGMTTATGTTAGTGAGR